MRLTGLVSWGIYTTYFNECDERHQTVLCPLRPSVDDRESAGGDSVRSDGKYSPFSMATGDSSTGEGSISCRENDISGDCGASPFFSLVEIAAEFPLSLTIIKLRTM